MLFVFYQITELLELFAHFHSHRIDFGNVTALTTNYETIMDNNRYHHSKEKMFVAASSWIMPKGSKLQVGVSILELLDKLIIKTT